MHLNLFCMYVVQLIATQLPSHTIYLCLDSVQDTLWNQQKSSKSKQKQQKSLLVSISHVQQVQFCFNQRLKLRSRDPGALG